MVARMDRQNGPHEAFLLPASLPPRLISISPLAQPLLRHTRDSTRSNPRGKAQFPFAAVALVFFFIPIQLLLLWMQWGTLDNLDK